jgi:hypothetical protein
VSALLPARFCEQILYAYTKRESRATAERDLAARCFRAWCKSKHNEFKVHEARDGYVQSHLTPVKPTADDSASEDSGIRTKQQKLDFL